MSLAQTAHRHRCVGKKNANGFESVTNNSTQDRMAKLFVPTDFGTIVRAVAAAEPGDSIIVRASYTGNKVVTITVDDLVVTAPNSLNGIELTLGSGVDRITLDGTADIAVIGNGRANVLFGNEGDNVLDGKSGQDRYFGSAGNDVFIGGGGADFDIADYSREKAAGGDQGIIANQSARRVQGGVDPDTVIDSFGDSDSIVGIRNIVGTDFADKFYGGGNANELSGLGGRDFILGGGGSDTLTGGSGADRFVYEFVEDSGVGRAARDRITDFSSAQNDIIDLEDIDANVNRRRDQDFTFIGREDFSGRAGELQFVSGRGGIVVNGDVDGDGVADFSIALEGLRRIGESDFDL